MDSAWADVFGPTAPPFGTNGTIDAMRSALQYRTGGRHDRPDGRHAARRPMRRRRRRSRSPATGFKPKGGGRTLTAIRTGRSQCLQHYGPRWTWIARSGRALDVQGEIRTTRVAPQPRLTPAEIAHIRDYRHIDQAGRREGLGGTLPTFLCRDDPGPLSDTSLNDGGGGSGKAAFGRRDTPSAADGVPTLAVPAGMNDRLQPVNIQFMGVRGMMRDRSGLPTPSRTTPRSLAMDTSGRRPHRRCRTTERNRARVPLTIGE